MDPMESIKQTYFQECDELLLAMEEGLIAMENGEADSEAINAVFRAVHSIKGGGGAFGFETLVSFAHVFETVLDHVRSGTLAPEADVVKVLLRAGDTLADHVAAARSGGFVADDEVKSELSALSNAEAEDLSASSADIDGLNFAPVMIDLDGSATPPQTNGNWRIRFVPKAGLYAKANEPFLLVRELTRLGTVEATPDTSRVPSLAALDPDESYLSWNITLKGCEDRQKIDDVFEFVTGDCELDIEAIAAAEPDPAPAVVTIADDVVLPAEMGSVEAAPTEKRSVAASGGAETQVRQTIRVDLDKVDRLVNLVGELVITQAMLSQRVTDYSSQQGAAVTAGLNELEHLLRELQEAVMAIRTQPVKSVFQRMPRLVRELAAQTNKQVHLVLEGEATEVDKTVIERLGEPLTHMIRNAIDHGLEMPDERVAAGKPPEGTVILSAEHRSGRIVIEVSDDGRGIDRDRVKQKAVEKGLISANENLSEEEIDNLIFMPGFSTAGQISNISGRGVGLDVVRRNIVELGGRIGIGSTAGKGSRFSFTLPLTLAVLDGMIVAVGDQTFVLPLSHIIESLLPKASDIRSFGAKGTLLNVRGGYVPMISVAELLGIEGGVTDPAAGVVILVESEGAGRMALAVDNIVGQRQVVIKSFESNFRHIEGIAAATILGDGRVALILDIDGLVSRCRDGRRHEMQQAVGA
ncbi:MAG: chemotaxis protein CheA [Alphaproteobacteria bacterium]|nr:chemotaxis protein CheA [Alphaproteobacteria bacterium]